MRRFLSAGTHEASSTPFETLLAGAAVLFVELGFIRYIPGQIRVLGYFTNFVLLAAFLGLGIGILLAGRGGPKPGAIRCLPPFCILAVIFLAQAGKGLHIVPLHDQVLFLGYATRGFTLELYPFLALSFTVLAASMTPLGYVMGWTLQGDRPVYRYGLNLAGGLVGIGAFALLSYVTAPPAAWLGLAGALSCVGALRAPPRWRWACVLSVAAVAASSAWMTRGAVWSPYQKISVEPAYIISGKGLHQLWDDLSDEDRALKKALPAQSGVTILVNEDSFQTMLDLSEAGVRRFPELLRVRAQYDLPYTLAETPPRDILILGAGTGNDAAAALRHGVASVDAVEIDPEIYKLGRSHPERPYDDPRVTVHLDDARHFLARTGRRYDVIVFAALDSHALNRGSNVRLDSFVFTRESFEMARSLLRPHGFLLVSHAVGRDWFFKRMRATLTAAFGHPPLVLNNIVPGLFGSMYMVGETVAGHESPDLGAQVLEDDWPFPYLKSKRVPFDYVVSILLIIGISFAAVAKASEKGWQGIDWHFFGLGAGFMLLETRGLVALALLMGSTWFVNSAIFAGVLAMALASAFIGSRKALEGSSSRWPYALLGGFLLLSFAIPMGTLTALPFPLGAAAGIFLVSSPMFASGLVFSRSLAREGSADRALASNLLGAMAGGLLENSSMVLGCRWLLVFAALFYAMAFMARGRKLVASGV